MRLWRWRRRWLCHRNIWCCQYVDGPNCNSSNDPHKIARIYRAHREAADA
jgi:hypothetical protein